MRLQVEIRRNVLPTVNIIYNTSAADFAVKSVSDFLTAIDRIVPLESADGEWGLEDYVVEVAATADQENTYECLHYQAVKDVFREDDEVIVRALTTEDLRERRRGGRLQISSDGRHLFDGVAWGRKFNPDIQRPSISIPPRKKRKLLTADDVTDSDHTLLQLEPHGTHAQIGTIIDEEYDEDEDDDFESDYEEDADEDSELEDDEVENDTENDNNSRQIVIREGFDDADVEDEHNSSDSEADDGEDTVPELQDDELQLLLEEAEELERAAQQLPLEARITSPSKKRKRSAQEQNSRKARRVSFELEENGTNGGFAGEEIQGTIGDHIVTLMSDTKPEISVKTLTEPVSSSERLENEPGDTQKTNGQISSELPVEVEDPFGFATSDEDTETDADSDDEASDSDSDQDPYTTTSSDSDADDSDLDSESGTDAESEPQPRRDTDTATDASSDNESTSSSGDSSSESEDDSSLSVATQQKSVSTPVSSGKLVTEPSARTNVQKPPGSGSKRTKANNDRLKRKKYLARLKKEGILPTDADFATLRLFEEQQDSPKTEANPSASGDVLSPDLARRKSELMARLNAAYGKDDTQIAALATEAEESMFQEADTENASVEQTVNVSPTHDQEIPTKDVAALEVSPRRARLDVESSRRMLFGSLGLKNPQTPEAEQALRERLSQPTRNIKPRQIDAEPSAATSVPDQDAWKNKLIISAVECVQDGLILSPPPFPFKQYWSRGLSKKQTRFSEQVNEPKSTRTSDPEVSKTIDEHANDEPPKPSTESKTISAGVAEFNDILHPDEIACLPQLTPEDAQVDALIAFKHLQLNARYEPQESEYQVARITAVEDDTMLMLLSKRYRDRRSSRSYDEETGERIYDKFEMPESDYEIEDDGVRELSFEDLIAPKLVSAAKVQVPASDQDQGSGQPGTQDDAQQHEADIVVPDSGPQHESRSKVGIVHVDTPRRNEITNIISEAGFNSALDEQLLRPIDVPKATQSTSISSHRSKTKSKHQQMPEPNKPASEIESTKNGLGNLSSDWRSSPSNADVEPDAFQTREARASVLEASESSPPSISMVETVDYPHVSQIDGTNSSLQYNVTSSSHQDAQRVSPDVSDIEHSNLTHLKVKSKTMIADVDSQASSLPSEVPQSQPDKGAIQIDVEEHSHDIPASLLRGGDATYEFRESSDSDDLDSDGLPSLRALTSSQKDRLNRVKSNFVSSAPARSQNRAKERLSPPPLRKSRSNGNIGRKQSLSPPRSAEKIKLSDSQVPSISISQIPAQGDTSVVDLTMTSSDPFEMSENGGGEDENSDGSDYEDSPRARRLAARSSQRVRSTDKEAQVKAKAMSMSTGLRGRKSATGQTRSRV